MMIRQDRGHRRSSRLTSLLTLIFYIIRSIHCMNQGSIARARNMCRSAPILDSQTIGCMCNLIQGTSRFVLSICLLPSCCIYPPNSIWQRVREPARPVHGTLTQRIGSPYPLAVKDWRVPSPVQSAGAPRAAGWPRDFLGRCRSGIDLVDARLNPGPRCGFALRCRSRGFLGDYSNVRELSVV